MADAKKTETCACARAYVCMCVRVPEGEEHKKHTDTHTSRDASGWRVTYVMAGDALRKTQHMYVCVRDQACSDRFALILVRIQTHLRFLCRQYVRRP